MRLIDADALKEKAFGKRGGLIHTSDIDAMPTIDPVRKGKWIDKHAGIATCSECGDRRGVHSMMKFCPSCGAKMGEGERHE